MCAVDGVAYCGPGSRLCFGQVVSYLFCAFCVWSLHSSKISQRLMILVPSLGFESSCSCSVSSSASCTFLFRCYLYPSFFSWISFSASSWLEAGPRGIIISLKSRIPKVLWHRTYEYGTLFSTDFVKALDGLNSCSNNCTCRVDVAVMWVHNHITTLLLYYNNLP